MDLASTEVFNLAPGDQAVAETAQGPVVVERPGAVKMAALGFDPVRSAMKYDLATPLLMANLLRWMAPEVFRRSDVQAGTVGTVNVTLEKRRQPGELSKCWATINVRCPSLSKAIVFDSSRARRGMFTW